MRLRASQAFNHIKPSFTWLQYWTQIRFEPGLNQAETHNLGLNHTVSIRSRVFWMVWGSRLFSMTEIFRFLAGMVRYGMAWIGWFGSVQEILIETLYSQFQPNSGLPNYLLQTHNWYCHRLAARAASTDDLLIYSIKMEHGWLSPKWLVRQA